MTAYPLATRRNDLIIATPQQPLSVAKPAEQPAPRAPLDVFEREPPVGSPLPALDNVLLTPHEAGTDRKSLQDMALSAAQAVVDLSKGLWPSEKVVNPSAKEKFRW